jgi:diguanylate cyclase (GGDEF)-like protein
MSPILSESIGDGAVSAASAHADEAARIGGLLMTTGTALLVCLALFVCAFLELLPWQVVIECTAGIATLLALFYLMVRTGLNRRFSDPSLATEQTAAAILFLAYIMYHAPAAREALTLFYLVLMLYGALRLSAARLAALSVLALAAHGLVLHFSYLRDEDYMDTDAALTEFAVLMVALPWFAAMGGYVNRLRTRLAEANRRLEQALERIRDIAIRDELTGTYNRRFLMEILAREQARAGRARGGYTVCLMDLDHFKAVNDRLGHAAGDEALRQVAAVGGRGLRSIDVFGRFGGEEFLLILPDTDLPGARTVAERIRAAVAGETRVTLTIGVAQHAAGEAAAAVLARADQALYRGKALGRNKVVVQG